jgi:hypothetical protein
MNWLSVLKVVAKVAVTTGAVDWAKGWLKKKIQGSAEKAEVVIRKKVKKVEKQVDEIFKELDK